MVVSHLHVFPYTMAPTVCSPGSCQRRLCTFIFVKSTHAAGVFTSDTGTPPHTHIGAAEVTESSSPGDGENKAGKVHKTVRK